MECLCGVRHLQLRRPVLASSLSRCSPPAPMKTFFATCVAPCRRLHVTFRASTSFQHNAPHSSWESLNGGGLGDALYSLLKPVYAAIAIGAALFFARVHKPPLALAVASPAHAAAQSDILPSPEDEEKGRPLTDEEKERTLEDYLDAYPEDTRSLRALMNLKIKARKFPEAIAILDRLILLEPEEKGLLLLKAHVQSYGRDAEPARHIFEEMLQRDPLFVEAYHGLVLTASQSESEGDLGGILKRIEGAMELCKKEKKKDQVRDFKLLVAQVKVIEGDYGGALKVYQDLVKEEPRDFRPYLCQGIIYTLLRRKDEAEKQFQKYRRLVPKGHPYAQYLDENMIPMNAFSQVDENTRTAALKW